MSPKNNKEKNPVNAGDSKSSKVEEEMEKLKSKMDSLM